MLQLLLTDCFKLCVMGFIGLHYELFVFVFCMPFFHSPFSCLTSLPCQIVATQPLFGKLGILQRTPKRCPKGLGQKGLQVVGECQISAKLAAKGDRSQRGRRIYHRSTVAKGVHSVGGWTKGCCPSTAGCRNNFLIR